MAVEIDERAGLLPLTSSWRDVQLTRLAVVQRGQLDLGETLGAIEDKIAREISRELRRHPIWPWLSNYPGLGGVHSGRLISIIGNPHRFPGRLCSAGHHHAAVPIVQLSSGSPMACGVELADGTICDAQVGPVRPGTGTRALWAYLGLHVVDGHLPRKRKGTVANWNPEGRLACLQPGGLAEQIVRHRVPVYREIYDAAKVRLKAERGAENMSEIESLGGPALTGLIADDREIMEEIGRQVDQSPAIERSVGLTPIETPYAIERAADRGQAGADDVSEGVHGLTPIMIEKRARTIAVKAFVGDLLRELKRVS